MKCPECQHEIAEGMEFCGQCGCAPGRVCAHHQLYDGPGRILVVDDEETVVGLAQDLLEMLGYTVTATTRGGEALRLFSADPSRFDLVITDQNMPKLTGLDLARNILTIRNNVPIILVTGDSSSTPPDIAKEAGIREFMTKPFTVDTLTDVVRRVLMTRPESDLP